ncbi:adenosine kinase [Idiomarina sp. PL1-037]|uniref:adenosine kinase n=1 Tax=unclassified Idiomarina TaxID=2614829 RepID=UPI00294AF35B|nr:MULTISPECIES: adenosine kinase [unclassified Idiomarina]MDV6327988.1 adenosine kinase [Idiomarina sp. Sol25]WQC53451.1 adenosine kinase [Idiomarina sp. PL1-037]
MKTIDVIGIGNALVDQEFEVSEDFLQKHDLKKGMMELIDEDAQNTLIAELSQLGELKKQSGGGSAANSLVAFAQFGGKAYYCCKVADDEAGMFYRQDLERIGIETSLHQQKNQGTTGRCLVMVTPDAERTMRTHLGITADLSTVEIDDHAIAAADYLYIEGYLITSEIARGAIQHAKKVARENNTKLVMTCSDPAMVKFFRSGIDEILDGGVDLMFCNREEAELLTGKDDPQAALSVLLEQADTVAITLGKDGAVIANRERQVHIPGVPVEAIDTNGAGDMFAGAMLYGLTRNMSLEDAGRLASHASAELVTKFGARLSKDRQQQLIERVMNAQTA